MKLNSWFLVVAIMIGSVQTVQAQSYDKLWNEVERFQKKALPKSALKQTEAIYRKAQMERNTPEMIKAYLLAMQYRNEITPDSLDVDIEGLEKWADETQNPLDAAVLHFILGDVYGNCLMNSPYYYRPVRMEEGMESTSQTDAERSGQRSFEHFVSALKDVGLLGRTSVDAFKPIVIKGNAGKYFQSDLLHMLGWGAVNSLERNAARWDMFYKQTAPQDSLPYWSTEAFLKMEIPQASQYDYRAEMLRIYQTMLNYYKQAGNREAALLVDLERLDFMRNNLFRNRFVKQEPSASPYYRQLQLLQKEYAAIDVCAEVYLQMAEFNNRIAHRVEGLRLVREAISNYPRYERINVLKNVEKMILNPACTINLPNMAYPGDSIKVKANYCNLQAAQLKLYRVDLPSDSEKLSDYEQPKFRSSYAKLTSVQELSFAPTPDYLTADTTFRMLVPKEGIYLVELVSKRKDIRPSYSLLYVSRLKVLTLSLPDGRLELVVLDGQSGHPVPQAEVLLYTRKDNRLVRQQTLAADADGTLIIEAEKYHAVRAVNGTDAAMMPMNIGRYYSGVSTGSRPDDRLVLFTDRSIYRPGQTVYVSGIAYRQQGDDTHVLANEKYTLQLLDTNNKEIGTKAVRTNELGSFAGEFVLPASGLTGRFALRAGNQWATIQVEEYKRPTFDVTFLPVEGGYTAGDSVWVKGTVKTFSGVPLQDATVKYDVKRSSAWRMWQGVDRLASGEVKTDGEGGFKIRVYLEKDNRQANYAVWYNTFSVNATVTDAAGETQSGSMWLSVGSSAYVLSAELPDKIIKEQFDKLTFSAKNLDGQPVKVKGEYAVYELTGVSRPEEEPGKCVLKASFVSDESFDPKEIKALPSGSYRLILTAVDSLGQEATYKEHFVLFSREDTKPPYDTNEWFYQSGGEFGQDETPFVLFGTSRKDVYVFYDVFSGNKRLESRRFLLTDSVARLVYPYREEYGEGILVRFAFVKDGVFYQESARIAKMQPDKKLEMKWSVFRDKLLPGQEEEWSLNIRYPDGRPAEAELLATLYDASLDKLLPHDWGLYMNFYRSIPYVGSRINDARLNYLLLDFPVKYLREEPLLYDRLIDYNLFRPFVRYKGMGANELLAGSMKARSTKAVEVSFQSEEAADAVSLPEAVSVEESGMVLEENAVVSRQDDSPESPDIPVRTDFAETAFFYPQLRTNADGEVSFAFTLPESLTEWKFMGLSHTKDMDWAKLTSTAVARKEFMVSPNMPRFLRVGDYATIASNIINLTDKNISGTVRMELFDPATDKVFLTQKKKFTAEAGKTLSVGFSFDVKENIGLTACRIVADGGTFSDGEQRYIPVLTDKEWITESVPMTIVGEETKTYSLKELFNGNSKTATERRLTVEFTGNPAWYAVQALPSLSNPTNDNAISWASAYYANNLASYILESNPKIKAVFDSWRAQGGTKETLLSNLQKNPDLKTILLEETPWLTEAVNEADQKQRIAVLFDLNTLQNNNRVVIDKLKELQTPEGAWTWFKGMNGSRYITQYIVEALARLSAFTGKALPADAQILYGQAFDYLNRKALEEYESMKKSEDKGIKDLLPSDLTIHYLYICALTEPKLPAGNRKANAYFIDKLAGAVRVQTIYGKALSAVILQKAGKTVAARDFINSLKEYAVQTKDGGMYYDTKRAEYSYSAYRIPTQVAVIEAMEQVAGDREAVEQLKLWLLMQKRTQAWDSPLATVNAVYALLHRGAGLLDSQGDVRITLGHTMLGTNSSAKAADRGLGYVKETFTGKEITSGMKSITVEKRDAGLAWGAVYAQYLEDMSRVKAQGGALSVTKQLFVEKMEDGRPQLIPLQTLSGLQVGDKVIVRLTVRSEQDMDFVQLKDERAACLEPSAALSGYRWQAGLGYYAAIKDAASEYFFDRLRKGVYTLDAAYHVSRSGEYASGIATLQSAYAPEYSAHTGSELLKVAEK